jgi:general secretion pathway protein G
MTEGKDKHFSFNHSYFQQDSSFVEKYPLGFYGFTLLETMIVVAIIGVLAAIATPSLLTYRTKAKIALAIAEIRIIEQEINQYLIKWDRLPDSLTEIKQGNIEDPWGNPYKYLKIGEEKGQPRKNFFMVPVNSDFDLYSMGKDGMSQSPFTSEASRDDIVRANDGKYVGLVSEY